MRISDWSADVCSSDLSGRLSMRTWVNSKSSGASFSTALASLRLNESLRRLPTNTATLVLAMGTAPSREGVPRLSAPVRKWRVKDGRDRSARDAVTAPASEIGRAAWRESVGQYV